MEIRWLGTATVEVVCQGKRLLVDPYFQKCLRTRKWQNPAVRQAVTRADAILITHPHLDHFSDIARITAMTDAPIYVAQRGIELAVARKAGVRTLCAIHDGMTVPVGDAMLVRVWRARHVQFDDALVRQAKKRAYQPAHYPRGLQLWHLNNIYTITDDDIFAFEVSGDGKRVFIMGSANLRKDVDYATGADALLFPYQGRSDLDTYSAPLIERLQPRRIILTHFDDAFPPISERIDTRAFLADHSNAIEPAFGKPVTI